ncbi:FG-GAP repeat domain-containing protein [Desulfosarcina ovata]|uniref:VCBS repeat-containing protein n=1 Tax=Desulfosarcina ovata subsp. ovata TaxID=2752305 RepID=A0A5K8AED4_9BACT|nr:VCBS repeat-containing protein [Desulfosarcina ovata]BBO90982.1 hypothetical protein DSCOOX_41620 [Desulfosarcina ovata subsp. ovata]
MRCRFSITVGLCVALLLLILPGYDDGSERVLITADAALAHFQDDSTWSEPSNAAYYFDDAEVTGDLATGDFNGDGIADLVFTIRTLEGYSLGTNLRMFRVAYGDGTFVEEDIAIAIDLDSDVDVFDMVVFDFNADGVPDIAFAEDGTNPSDTGRGSVQAFLSPGPSE